MQFTSDSPHIILHQLFSLSFHSPPFEVDRVPELPLQGCLLCFKTSSGSTEEANTQQAGTLLQDEVIHFRNAQTMNPHMSFNRFEDVLLVGSKGLKRYETYKSKIGLMKSENRELLGIKSVPFFICSSHLWDYV